MSKIAVLTVVFLLAGVSAALSEDIIELKDGRVMKGKLVKESDDQVVFEYHSGSIKAQLKFKKEDVTKITRGSADEKGPSLQEQPPTGEDKVADYVRDALRLYAEGKKRQAYFVLKNARLFGRETKRINEAIKDCPQTKEGYISGGLEDIERLATTMGAIDVKIEKLAGMVSVSGERDQIEATMLLDQRLVGDCRVAEGTVGEIEFFTFLRKNCLSDEEIRKLYGRPNKTFKSDEGFAYSFYGRMMFMRKPGQPQPAVFRFAVQGKTAVERPATSPSLTPTQLDDIERAIRLSREAEEMQRFIEMGDTLKKIEEMQRTMEMIRTMEEARKTMPPPIPND